MSKSNNKTRNLLEVMKNACELAESIQRKAKQIQSLVKSDRSPVTVADYSVQVYIIKKLRELFPNDPIVAEEDSEEIVNQPDFCTSILESLESQGLSRDFDLRSLLDYATHCSVSNNRYWVLDPIDGTKGFLRGEQFAISLACIEEGEVVEGFLGCPNDCSRYSSGFLGGGIYYARKGEGAFFQRLADEKVFPLSVKDQPGEITRFCGPVESGHGDHLKFEQVGIEIGVNSEPIRLDGQGKYGIIAAGDASAYLRIPKDHIYKEKIWDHAAGMIIVKESGGLVTDTLGKPIEILTNSHQLTHNYGIVASVNRDIHEKVIDVLSST